jgi:hypothetical protein
VIWRVAEKNAPERCSRRLRLKLSRVVVVKSLEGRAHSARLVIVGNREQARYFFFFATFLAGAFFAAFFAGAFFAAAFAMVCPSPCIGLTFESLEQIYHDEIHLKC